MSFFPQAEKHSVRPTVIFCERSEQSRRNGRQPPNDTSFKRARTDPIIPFQKKWMKISFKSSGLWVDVRISQRSSPPLAVFLQRIDQEQGAMIAQFVIAVALVAVTCNKAFQSRPAIRLARPMITRRFAFKENESSKMEGNSQLVVSTNVGTPMKSSSTGTIADTSSFTLADASVFGFGSLIALAVIPVAAFLAWQKISKPADDASTEIRGVSGERSLREEEIKTIREKAQKEEGTRSSLIANARADVEKRVAEAKRQEETKQRQQPVEKESVVQLLEQEFKKEAVTKQEAPIASVQAEVQGNIDQQY